MLGVRAPEEPMKLKLYSGPLSLFTAKVRIALDEKDLPYERIEVGWSLADRYLPHHPEVARLNPKRQVPVLVDGDVVVCDSTLILEYLEDTHPEPPLYPRDAAGRARCRQLEDAADATLFAPIWDLIEGVFYAAAAGGGPAERVEAARSDLARQYAALDAELEGREYLCGAFSVADIGSFVMLNAAATLGAPPDAGLGNLHDWLARTGGRPAVKRESETMAAYAAKALAGASQA
jgi:glutathione S-transferase